MERIAGGAFVFFVLIVGADFDTTAPIAVAFAYLILISALLLKGPAAFANLSKIVSPKGA